MPSEVKSDLKNKNPIGFLWVDLEMTGLDEKKDVIIELSAIVTDANFKELERYQSLVLHKPEEIENLMAGNQFWQKFPKNKQYFLDNIQSGAPLGEVEQKVVDLAQKHLPGQLVILAGNSIHSDKQFIESYMPKLNALLHYRLLDVSSWKVVMQSHFGVRFQKPEVHRAEDDILGSIQELTYYLDRLSRVKIKPKGRSK